MNKKIPFLLSSLVCLALGACSGTGNNSTSEDEEEEETTVEICEIDLYKTTQSYEIGSDVDLSDAYVNLTYTDESTKRVTYKNFSNYDIEATLYYDEAAYTSSTFDYEGEYYLYVCYSENTAIEDYVEITVNESGEVYPTEVALPSSISMVEGDEKTITPTWTPSSTSVKEYTFTSSDEAVATITDDGELTAVSEGSTTITITATAEEGTISDTCEVTVTASSSGDIEVDDQTGDFTITTSDGVYSKSSNIYTITAAGTYSLEGSLEGQIVVEAGEEDEVVLELNGITITYDENSPLLATSADKVEISAKSGTQNTIYDNRSTKTTDDNGQGEGAISADCDLKLKGTGALYVEGNYNNGVHTTKDLTIQKLTLQTKAYNNALKGKDSIEIKSGTIEAISTNGDGIKTVNTDISSQGNQRGTVSIADGIVDIYAAGDGVQAAYNFEMSGGTLNVHTYSYSSYTASRASVSSFKGIKADNYINITGGELTIKSYDDGLHCDYGTSLENGSSGVGTINISGGTVNIAVNSTSNNTVSSADGIHADNTININGGEVNVSSSLEGVEANFINVSDGSLTVYATDDGLNASNKIGYTPAITISGGTVDITMGTGDTDGIDSNGSFTQTGGVVITRGAPNSSNGMATGLDCDGTARISGGTFIQLGPRETVPSLSNTYTLSLGSSSGGMGGMGGRPGSSSSSSSSSYTFSSGTWTISSIDVSFTVASSYKYYGCTVYSSLFTSGTTYTVSNGSTSYSGTAS